MTTVTYRTAPFTARIAEDNPVNDRLYEVVTQDGERIASATNLLACQTLVASLHANLRAWSENIGFDAVIEGVL